MAEQTSVSKLVGPKNFYIKVCVFNEKPHFGPGMIKIMKSIREGNTLKATCESMYLSYSKAWHKIKESEADLGCELIRRRRGGASYGSSCLTEDGIELFEKYLQFEEELNTCGQRLFDKYFHDHGSEH